MLRVIPVGSSTVYVTKFANAKPTLDQELLNVKKITVSIDQKLMKPQWLDLEDTLQVIVDKLEFSSGKTKKVFKVRGHHLKFDNLLILGTSCALSILQVNYMLLNCSIT